MKGQVQTRHKEDILTMRMVKHCNRMPREMANALSLEIFKCQLDRALSNLIKLKTYTLNAWGVD